MICLSYFTGIAWYVFCSYYEKEESFITLYDLDSHGQNLKKAISMTYFTFTTMSTVGLGDFHPKQNSERVLCSFIMLFGVMFTSLLMDAFS